MNDRHPILGLGGWVFVVVLGACGGVCGFGKTADLVVVGACVGVDRAYGCLLLRLRPGMCGLNNDVPLAGGESYQR